MTLEDMSIEELADLKLDKKAEINAIRGDIAEAHAVYTRKVEQMHVDLATQAVTEAAAASGRTPEEQANFWLSEQYADIGRHVLAKRFLEQRIVNARDVT